MTDSFQWERCDPAGSSCVDIAGATAATYVPTSDDAGHDIRARGYRNGILVGESNTVGPISAAPAEIRWFADTMFANTKMPGTLTPDPNNATYQAALGTLTGIFGNGLATVSGGGSAPVYHATNTTPTKTVTLEVEHNGSTSFSFPWDPSWHVSPDSDHHAIVIRPDGHSFCEFQGLVPGSNTAHAAAEGDLAAWDGIGTNDNNVAPISTAIGLIRPEEIAAGVIGHAIRCALPNTGGTVRPPAHHQDGTGSGPPCGALLALPRTADISALTGMAHMVAVALQEYGARVSDASGGTNMAIYFQSTCDGVTVYPASSCSMPKSIVSQLVTLA